MSQLVVMAIRPSIAEIVYKGQKIYEYRRVRTKIYTGDRILVYESFPVSLITGEFIAGRVLVGKPYSISRLESRERIKALVNQYLNGAEVATAIEIVNLKRWRVPKPFLELFPDLTPPQSYIFVKERSDGLLCCSRRF